MVANSSTKQKLLKTKIKSYCDDATEFHDKETPDVDSNYAC